MRSDLNETIRGIRQLSGELAAKKVFCRLDLNVPLSGGAPSDTARVEQSVPTIDWLARQGAKVILATHLGYPKGRVVEGLRTVNLTNSLRQLSSVPLRFTGTLDFDEMAAEIRRLPDGHALLLENVRFHAGEEENDPTLAQSFAALADIYVNDAFSVSHRPHASVSAIGRFLPSYAGLALERELAALGRIGHTAAGSGALVGGNKGDKLEVLPSLVRDFSIVCVGGLLGYALRGVDRRILSQSGIDIATLQGKLDAASTAIGRAPARVILPVDATVEDAGGNRSTVPVEQLAAGMRIRDIGDRTAALFAQALCGTKTLLWNGPLGAYEEPDYVRGSAAVLQPILANGTYIVCGGGDTLALCAGLGIKDALGHCSTGGGALLRYIQGAPMPGLNALVNSKERQRFA